MPKRNTNKSKKKKTTTPRKPFAQVLGFRHTDNLLAVIGCLLLLVAIYITVAFISYFSTGAADQSLVRHLQEGDMANTQQTFRNICGSTGALLSHFCIARGFGIIAFTIPFFIGLCGVKLISDKRRLSLTKWFCALAVVTIWCSVAFAKLLTPLLGDRIFNPGGDHGQAICQAIENVAGAPGLFALLIIVAVVFLSLLGVEVVHIVSRKLNPMRYLQKVKWDYKTAPDTDTAFDPNEGGEYDNPEVQRIDYSSGQPTVISTEGSIVDGNTTEMEIIEGKETERATKSTLASNTSGNKPIDHREPFINYRYPTLDLLKTYENDSRPVIDLNEQERNKNRIIDVLHNFGVDITHISATVGPTITLYEITPAPGIRISKIKNLEDDIAMSLYALGIRIIAPIPGKGTIGIEVPNAKPAVVSMRSILDSKAFQETKMELPMALGKTITNEIFMADLTKIPHLLVAGATGQGKSVGMNAIITSLLYKKHPNELKFVLVDPKKVEFSVYAPITKPFMAALIENEDNAIITDTQKVVRTLNGLCALMDNRYDMLKAAGARNVKEYNEKFLNHKLNRDDGHEYMPYIVVIIDEFGDLILTSGKEIETPITRIAQLARAVGIHMIIATQRPSARVITGGIKANFPGRIAFKVAQRIDSQIILDRTGANQLIGRGDMLYSKGDEPVRVQCAFVDTPEVERISQFIAEQNGPIRPLELPEPVMEDSMVGGIASGDEMEGVDPLFEEAARLVINENVGSTSMLQRKMTIGFNRAGRLMDELQKAGIVGPPRGSKPREVLVQDEGSLQVILNQIRKK